MTPTPSATSTDATTATEPVVCPRCGSLLYQQPRAGKSSMMCAGCHTTLAPDGQQLENINLSRGPQANRVARAIVPIGTNGWAIAASYVALITLLSCGVASPFALILGIIALVSIKKNPGQRGKIRAWFSIVMGTGVMILIGVAILMAIFTASLETRPGSSGRLNSESWDVVKHPDDTAANYEAALEKATRASDLAPSDVNILNTLGIAQYRAAHYQQCIETLTRADHSREVDVEISDWTFIAMSHHRLGDHDAAQKALSKARRIIADDKIEPGSEDAGFVKEMEDLFASKPLPDDDSN